MGTAVPKPEPEEKIDENSSPSIETIPRSDSEASMPQFEDGYLDGFSVEADQLDMALNPQRIPASDSGLSSPDSRYVKR